MMNERIERISTAIIFGGLLLISESIILFLCLCVVSFLHEDWGFTKESIFVLMALLVSGVLVFLMGIRSISDDS